MKEIAKALCAAQSVMGGAKKNKKNPFFKSTYSDLESVFEALRDPFAENGLSITQPLAIEDGKQIVITRIMHISGEFIESKMFLPEVKDIQKMGGALTYIKRYELQSLAGLPSEDDDGNEASAQQKKQSEWISEDKYSKMIDVIAPYPELVQELKKICKVSDLKKINTNQMEACGRYASKYIKDLEVKEEVSEEC